MDPSMHIMDRARKIAREFRCYMCSFCMCENKKDIMALKRTKNCDRHKAINKMNTHCHAHNKRWTVCADCIKVDVRAASSYCLQCMNTLSSKSCQCGKDTFAIVPGTDAEKDEAVRAMLAMAASYKREMPVPALVVKPLLASIDNDWAIQALTYKPPMRQ